jgi:hypothetical protein
MSEQSDAAFRKALDYRTKAELEVASSRGSVTKAVAFTNLAQLYLVEWQLRADAPHPPDAA